MAQILAQNFNSEDSLATAQHHDAITGTAAQYVTFDYEYKLAKSWNQGALYKAQLRRLLQRATGLNVADPNGLESCNQLSQNETVVQCPVYQHAGGSEFLVVVHNPSN